MVEIPLTRGKVAFVDDADYGSLSRNRWYLTAQGYAARGGGSVPCVLMHRQIMSPGAGLEVDHIDGDKLNNTRANLRVCTHAQNMANIGKRPGKRVTASAYTGVFKVHRRWKAEINVAGRFHYLGLFKDEIDAALAYDRAARDLRGDFARLNFPDGPPTQAVITHPRDAAA